MSKPTKSKKPAKGVIKTFSFELSKYQADLIAKHFTEAVPNGHAFMLGQPVIFVRGNTKERLGVPAMLVAIYNHKLFDKLQAVLKGAP